MQFRAVLCWQAGCLEVTLRLVCNPHPGWPSIGRDLHQQFCWSKSNYLIGVAGALLRVSGHKSLDAELHPSLLITCADAVQTSQPAVSVEIRNALPISY